MDLLILREGKILNVKAITEEMKDAYMDYSMSVIIGRALPDVRDGLKPVHRRILYAMHEIGMTNFKKSARIVGAVLGQYHPHGDTAIYDAVVRMTQDFSLRYPLIDGQGNFGSIDGDTAAAMRYTEARLSAISKEMLEDIDKDTIDMTPNFDDTLKEPTVLPAKVPNLLINGASGIAVGMATNIPPHNLSEVINGIIATINNPDITNDELMEYIKGPDFPTGGVIKGIKGIRDAYNQGKGKIFIQGQYFVENFKGGDRKRIIITEIPYMVNKSKLIEKIAELVINKKITGISDIRDESDRNGMRIVIELKSGVNPDIVINNLYTHTNLRTTFGVINLVLVKSNDGKLVPRILKLNELIKEYIKHRVEVIERRTKYEKNKAEKRIHTLEGLIFAINHIDRVIEILKSSPSTEAARISLKSIKGVGQTELTDKQINAIFDMRLQQLIKLEKDKLINELNDLKKKVKEFNIILTSEDKLNEVIIKELKELDKKYGDKRRTEIDIEDYFIESPGELIPEEKVVFLLTREGYVKSISIESYKSQKRGGKGMTAMKIGDEDEINEIFACSNHDKMFFFTNKGKVFSINVYEIPPSKKRMTKGIIVNKLVHLDKDEKINAVLPVKEEDFNEDYYLTIATKFGLIKKTEIKKLKNIRQNGIIIITLKEGDDLIDVKMTNGENDIILGTKNGFVIRFNESEVRPTGRTSQGVIGIDLRPGDEVIEMAIVNNLGSLLTITSTGFGKRTTFKKYNRIHRGGKGVFNIQLRSKNEEVVSIKTVNQNDEIMLMTYYGNIIRIPVSDIRIIGRRTHGVTLIRFNKENEKERVVAVAKIDESLISKVENMEKRNFGQNELETELDEDYNLEFYSDTNDENNSNIGQKD
ncbi:MAG: DNA gyrase subunit A [Candidatus Helarchaeota archaeon]